MAKSKNRTPDLPKLEPTSQEPTSQEPTSQEPLVKEIHILDLDKVPKSKIVMSFTVFVALLSAFIFIVVSLMSSYHSFQNRLGELEKRASQNDLRLLDNSGKDKNDLTYSEIIERIKSMNCDELKGLKEKVEVNILNGCPKQ